MAGSLKFIIFLSVYSAALAVVFDFEYAEVLSGEPFTLSDLSGLKLKTLSDNGWNITFLYGSYTYKHTFTASDQMRVTLQYVADGAGVYNADISICDYFGSFFKTYLAPIRYGRSSIPPDTPICPMKPGTYQIYEAKNISQLDGPSELKPGIYDAFIRYHISDLYMVGGLKVRFRVIDLS